MITAALIGAIGLAAALTGVLTWQIVRNANAGDARLKESEKRARLERRIDAQSHALEDRDAAVRSLESTLAREKARSAALQAQLDDFLQQVNPDEIPTALRAALARYRKLLQVPEAEDAGDSTAEGD